LADFFGFFEVNKMENFQKFELAIQTIFDPLNNSKKTQQEANEFLEKFLSSPNILFEFSLNYLILNFNSNQTNSLFWTIQQLISIYKNQKFENINSTVLHVELLKLVKVKLEFLN
jgi:hypothetical protein